MSVRTLEFAEPFFTVRLVSDEPEHEIVGKSILLNLSSSPIQIHNQSLQHLQLPLIHT